jgi:3-hydroxyacyl-[acyl-carrier-protein] dehydratase
MTPSCSRTGPEEILGLLPHRAPFLFVREVSHVREDEATGRCRWDADNPIFQGHFPQLAIVPGVLLVEGAAQLAGVHLATLGRQRPQALTQPIGVLTGVRRALVHRPVRPDTDVEYCLSFQPPLAGMFLVRATATVGGQRCLSCEISIAVVERATLVDEFQTREGKT